MTHNPKLKTREEMVGIIDALKREGKKVVVLSGSFDLIHAGHAAYLAEARTQGDALIVLLNSDSSIRGYKGETRPIVPEENRAELLAALACVDYIVLFDDLTPLSLLETLHPTVYCNGADWGENCIEKDVVEKHGGRVHIIDLINKAANSSSAIIKRIVDTANVKTTKAIFLDRDGVLNDDKDGYLHKVEDMELLPGVIPALKRLSDAGYVLIVITNQSGIGRGIFTEQDFATVSQWLTDILAKDGVTLSGIYHCPHHPDDGCLCRKPGIALVTTAAKEHGVVLGNSWFVGDSCSDIAAGRLTNMKTVKVGGASPDCKPYLAHFYAKDLPEATEFILNGKGV